MMTPKPQERKQLEYFLANESVPPPKGLGGVGLSNFIMRGWIVRDGGDPETGERFYKITTKGIEALYPKKD